MSPDVSKPSTSSASGIFLEANCHGCLRVKLGIYPIIAPYGLNKSFNIFVYLALLLPLQGCNVTPLTPPYPPSPLIKDVVWDYSSHRQAAPGSDLWPITWTDDDNLYTAWGDGGGFGGTNSQGRVTLGVARIKGGPDNLQATNIFGGKDPEAQADFNGKSNGLISIDSVLYTHVVEQDKWLRAKIGRSADHGRTWIFNSSTAWDFAEPDGAFSDLTFLNFGKDYQGARDNYVYVYSQDKRASMTPDFLTSSVAMFRVLKDQIMNRNAYEYFAGLDSNNNPQWTKEIAARKPVFSDANGVGWGVRVQYNAGLKRYLLSVFHGLDGSWGIFDAPEPWGPWTTVAYYNQWIDSEPKFGFSLPAKWLSADGKRFVMVWSGTGKYDSWNTLAGSFVLRTTAGQWPVIKE